MKPIGRSKSWCCAGLQGAHEEAGSRGLAVFVDNTHEPARFVLQFRAIDAGAEPPQGAEELLSTCIQTGLQFCPWCGVELGPFYRKRIQELARPDLLIPLD